MDEFSLRSALIKNTGVQIAAQALSLCVGLMTAMVLSRYLGVEGFGQFNYIFAFFYFFLTINDFGVNVIVVREISKRREKAGEIIGAMLSFKLILAVGSMLTAWAIIRLMNFPEGLKNALFVYTLILPVLALELPAAIFQALLKLEYPALIGIVNRVLGFLLLMLMVWTGYGLTALVGMLVLVETGSLLLILKHSRPFVRPIWRFKPQLWKDVLRSSITLGVMGIFVAIINRAGFIMLERMTDLRQVGLYSAAHKVTSLLEAFPLMVMGTIYPLMSRYAGEDLDKLRALHKRSVFYLGLIALPMGVSITALSPFIVRMIFGEQFAQAGKALAILVWSAVFLYAALSSGNLLISMGREKINLALTMIGAGLSIALNFLLIPAMGFVGVAVATTAVYFFLFISSSAAVYTVLYHPDRKADPTGHLKSKAATRRLPKLTLQLLRIKAFALLKQAIATRQNIICKIPGLMRLCYYGYRILKPRGIVLAEAQGLKMYVNIEDDVIAPEILAYGFHEEYETELFKKIIKPSMVVVDIGANIGYYSLIAAKLVGESGKVYTFEPDPINYRLLLANIKANRFTNIIPIERLVSNKSGKTKLFLDKGNWGAHTLCEKNIQTTSNGCIEIEAVTLDDFFKDRKIGRADFIKMDVQGSEGLVVEKSFETLRHNDLTILMEFWPSGLRNLGTNPLRLLQHLRQLGYFIKVILHGTNREIGDIEQIAAIGETKGYVNLLLEKRRLSHGI